MLADMGLWQVSKEFSLSVTAAKVGVHEALKDWHPAAEIS
jgi:hypothetical protein